MAALESRAYVYTGDIGEQVPRDVTHVRVDASVTIIPESAFQGLEHLVEAELPEGLLEIGDRAFYDCGSLSQINFPSTLRKIGKYAFSCPYSSPRRHYGKLVDITLPEGLIEIGVYSFAYQKSFKRIKIPSPVGSIGEGAFYECAELEHVELCEGLEVIPRCAFYFCSLLKRINIPSTVRTIGKAAFSNCVSLEQIVLPHGLECVEMSTFISCTSLERVEIPSTVKSIKYCAFKGCYEMTGANIPDSVERIGDNAFQYWNNFRLPPLLGKVDCSMMGSNNVFSIELPETLRSLKGLSKCPKNLRNIAIPKDCGHGRLFDGGRGDIDLHQAFPLSSRQEIEFAVVKRFEGLPIHELCYYQSYKSTAVLLKEFNRLSNHTRMLRSGSGGTKATGNQQDCLGMTPLHILACSARPNLELCRVLIDRYPQSLIAKDKWGDIPLLYAVWSNASPEMVQLMVNSFNTVLPGQTLDWKNMVVTLSKGCLSLNCMKNLLELQKSFCNCRLDLREVITEVVESDSCRHRTMKLLLEYDIETRVGSLNVGRWGQRISQMLEKCANMTQRDWRHEFVEKTVAENVTAVYSALTQYEQIKEAMALLELALWKAKLGKCTSQVGENAEGCERKAKKAKKDSSLTREQCRITCGADIIVPNVFAYL